jgi:hypothetical protein
MKSSYIKTGKITLEGLPQLKLVIDGMPDAAASAAEKALTKVCLDLQGKAQLLAPVETGDLRGAAYAEVHGMDGEVGFALPYALAQHEGLTFKHPKGGQARYLAQPFEENVDKYKAYIERKVAEEVAKP